MDLVSVFFLPSEALLLPSRDVMYAVGEQLRRAQHGETVPFGGALQYIAKGKVYAPDDWLIMEGNTYLWERYWD